MKLKPLIWGVTVLVLLAVLAWGVQTVVRWRAVSGGKNKGLLQRVDLEKLHQVVLLSEDEQIHLDLSDKGWRVREQQGYPADELKLRMLLSDVNRLKLDRQVSEGEEALEALGLIPPERLLMKGKASEDAVKADKGDKAEEAEWLGQQLQLLDKQGRPLFVVTVGEQRSSKGSAGVFAGQYLRIGDESVAWITGTSLALDDFSFAWVEKRLFMRGLGDALRLLRLERGGQLLVEIERASAQESWRLSGVEGELNMAVVSELVRTMDRLELVGLEHKPPPRRLGPGRSMRLQLQLADGLSYDLRFNENPSKAHATQHLAGLSAAAGKDADENIRQQVVRLNEVQAQHTLRLSRWDMERLPVSPQELLKKTKPNAKNKTP